MFKDALPIIFEVAPTIAKALINPMGTATGFVLPLLADAFNVHPGNLAGIASIMMSDDDAKNKLQQIENDYGDIIKSFGSSLNNLASAEVNIKMNWIPDQKLQ